MAEQEGAEARGVAVEVLSDLVREVDLLPGRNEAVKVTLAGARGIQFEGFFSTSTSASCTFLIIETTHPVACI